jgi:hypothetical protein
MAMDALLSTLLSSALAVYGERPREKSELLTVSQALHSELSLFPSDFPRFSLYHRARVIFVSSALLHALAGGCEEDVESLSGNGEHDANSFPGKASNSVFQPAL